MTRRQLNLAAKLYSLAMVAHIDAGGADSDDEAKVMGNAAKRANTALRRLGVDRGDIITIQDAIDKARELRPLGQTP